MISLRFDWPTRVFIAFFATLLVVLGFFVAFESQIVNSEIVGVGLGVDLVIILPGMFYFLILRPKKLSTLYAVPVVTFGLIVLHLLVDLQWPLGRILLVAFEFVLIAVVVAKCVITARKAKKIAMSRGKVGQNHDALELIRQVCAEIIPTRFVSRLFAFEISMLYFAIGSWFSKSQEIESQRKRFTFTSHRENA